MAVVFSAFAREESPFAGLHPSAYPIGKGGYVVRGGFASYDGSLPGPNQVAITDNINIGGVQTRREIAYKADAGLVPLTLGFGVGERTDFYVTAGIGSGTSQKRISNFYGVQDDLYLAAKDRYDRVYDQPLFDFGMAVLSQLKPDLGDGLPAVGVRVSGRFGYTADDHGVFKDSTPEDGFPDFGGDVGLIVSQRIGEYAVAHGSAAFSAMRKLGSSLQYGGAIEFVLIPDRMVVSADYRTRHEFVGNEYTSTKDKTTAAVRYHLSKNVTAELASSFGGNLFLTLTRLGARETTITPKSPSAEGSLF
jgi:hypothetical protein